MSQPNPNKKQAPKTQQTPPTQPTHPSQQTQHPENQQQQQQQQQQQAAQQQQQQGDDGAFNFNYFGNVVDKQPQQQQNKIAQQHQQPQNKQHELVQQHEHVQQIKRQEPDQPKLQQLKQQGQGEGEGQAQREGEGEGEPNKSGYESGDQNPNQGNNPQHHQQNNNENGKQIYEIVDKQNQENNDQEQLQIINEHSQKIYEQDYYQKQIQDNRNIEKSSSKSNSNPQVLGQESSGNKSDYSADAPKQSEQKTRKLSNSAVQVALVNQEEEKQKQRIEKQYQELKNKNMLLQAELLKQKQLEKQKQQQRLKQKEEQERIIKEKEKEKQLLLQKEKQKQIQRQKQKQKQRQIQKQKQKQKLKQIQEEKQKEKERAKLKEKQLQKQIKRTEKLEDALQKQKQRTSQIQKQNEEQRRLLAEKEEKLRAQQKEKQKAKLKEKQLQKEIKNTEKLQEELQKQKQRTSQIQKQNEQQRILLAEKQAKLKAQEKQLKKLQKQKKKKIKQQQEMVSNNTSSNPSNQKQKVSSSKVQKVQNPPSQNNPPPPANNSTSSQIQPIVVAVPPPVPPPVQSQQQQQASQIHESMIIKQAQKQRIYSTLKMFMQYIDKHKLHINNQKSVLINVYEQIDRRKSQKYVWYHLIKQFLTQYQGLAKNFHEQSYKLNKQQKILNKNTFLNIGQELKQGIDQLAFLKRQSGNDYNRMNDHIGKKISLQLEVAFNKFISQMNRGQNQINQKKKIFIELQEQFRKRAQKMIKIYNRGREGKPQDQDVFVQTCKFIQLQKQFRYSLIVWGKGIIDLRKILITLEIKLNEQIQIVLNQFKTIQANIYSFHQQVYENIINSKQQIYREDKFSKLCTLSDSDYIKYTYEFIQKNPISQVSDKNFQYFIQMPHFQSITGKSSDLLKGMINKSFILKNSNQQLINTISGNLVQFNRQTSEYKDKFIVKNLSATIVADGVIQFDQIIPGIIFNDHRTIRIGFRDQDRAEELICLLNEKV